MIQGSVFLVTGGSAGDGWKVVQALLDAGGFVAILDIQQPPIKDEHILFLQVDITSEKEVWDALDATKRKYGKLNGIINCAKVAEESPLFVQETVSSTISQQFIKALEINLFGTFNVIRLAVPYLMESSKAIIINISSVLGYRGKLGYLSYSTSQAGVLGMSEALSKELESFNIRIVDIAPEVIDDIGDFVLKAITVPKFNEKSQKFD